MVTNTGSAKRLPSESRKRLKASAKLVRIIPPWISEMHAKNQRLSSPSRLFNTRPKQQPSRLDASRLSGNRCKAEPGLEWFHSGVAWTTVGCIPSYKGFMVLEVSIWGLHPDKGPPCMPDYNPVLALVKSHHGMSFTAACCCNATVACTTVQTSQRGVHAPINLACMILDLTFIQQEQGAGGMITIAQGKVRLAFNHFQRCCKVHRPLKLVSCRYYKRTAGDEQAANAEQFQKYNVHLPLYTNQKQHRCCICSQSCIRLVCCQLHE